MARFYVFLLVLMISASCGNEPVKGKADEQNYYLEFVNLEGSNVSDWTIRAVKTMLVGKGYYYGAEPHSGQWIRGIGYVDSANMALLSEHFTKVHRFRDISEYDPSDVHAQKIVITYNPLTKDDITNFNFHAYEKPGGKEWESVFNPGNFRFTPEATKKDLGVWMSDLIVKLTFK